MVQLVSEERGAAFSPLRIRPAVDSLVGAAVRENSHLAGIAGKVAEMQGAAGRAMAGFRGRVRERLNDSPIALAPASLTLSKASPVPAGDTVFCSPLHRGRFMAMIPGDSVAEQVITSGLFSTLNIYNTLLIGRLILTWFPNPPSQIVYPLSTICDPYLGLFRGIIPPLGGIDLSPILAFTVLNVFTNTAAALPCELEGYESKTHPGKKLEKRGAEATQAQKKAEEEQPMVPKEA